jgi:MinD superfamily P-loop ATPase
MMARSVQIRCSCGCEFTAVVTADDDRTPVLCFGCRARDEFCTAVDATIESVKRLRASLASRD